MELSKNFTSKVGGIGGLGASEASTEVSIEKHIYAPGEKIRVTFDHDNT